MIEFSSKSHLAPWGFYRGPLSAFADLLRHSRFLTWSLILSLIQLLEVLILSELHFVHLSPGGLQFLRLISSLSLFAPLLAYFIRFRPPASRHPESVQWAQFLFFWTSIVSLLLLIAIQFSNLHLSTSSLFRAVLVSGLVLLPFDLANTCLLYGRPIHQSAWNLKHLRRWSVILLSVSLIFLAMDQIILFLVFKSAPRFLLFYRLIRERNIPWWPRWRWPQILPSGLIVFFLFDLSFFVWSLPISRQDPETSFLVFALHKLVHLATLMAIKLQITGKWSLLLSHKSWSRPWIARLFLNVCIFSPVFLIFFLLYEIRWSHFLSPNALGEDLQISILGLSALAIVVLFRLSASQVWLRSALHSQWGKGSWLYGASFILCWPIYYYWPSHIYPYFSPTEQLALGGMIDILFCTFLSAAAVWTQSRFKKRRSQSMARFIDFLKRRDFWIIQGRPLESFTTIHSDHHLTFGKSILTCHPDQLLLAFSQIEVAKKMDPDLPPVSAFQRLFQLAPSQEISAKDPQGDPRILRISVGNIHREIQILSETSIQDLLGYLRIFVREPRLLDMGIWRKTEAKRMFHAYFSTKECFIYILPKELSPQIWSYRYWAFIKSQEAFSR